MSASKASISAVTTRNTATGAEAGGPSVARVEKTGQQPMAAIRANGSLRHAVDTSGCVDGRIRTVGTPCMKVSVGVKIDGPSACVGGSGNAPMTSAMAPTRTTRRSTSPSGT
jgi:hypothetical protein